jgi:hypothetical protein
MRYLDETDRAASANRVKLYFQRLIADNLVARTLQDEGYSYVFMPSGIDTYSITADLVIDLYATGAKRYRYPDPPSYALTKEPFLPLLLESSLLRNLNDYIDNSLPVWRSRPLSAWRPERAAYTWDEAERIAAMPEATFAFIHIMKPHQPLAFTRDGTMLSTRYESQLTTDERIAAHIDQFAYINERTLQMIEAILAESDTPPIIIIQGDHGSYLGEQKRVDGQYVTFEILNAMYFPGRSDCLHDRAMIAIHTFPTLLNCYFGGDTPLLPPRFFAVPFPYENILNYEEK